MHKKKVSVKVFPNNVINTKLLKFNIIVQWIVNWHELACGLRLYLIKLDLAFFLFFILDLARKRRRVSLGLIS